jgi:hypothetical protein
MAASSFIAAAEELDRELLAAMECRIAGPAPRRASGSTCTSCAPGNGTGRCGCGARFIACLAPTGIECEWGPENFSPEESALICPT